MQEMYFSLGDARQDKPSCCIIKHSLYKVMNSSRELNFEQKLLLNQDIVNYNKLGENFMKIVN